MSAELTQVLYIVLVISVACTILSPIISWVLPDRNKPIKPI